MRDDITIIIQGPLNTISLNNIEDYLKHGKVIVSHYACPNGVDTDGHPIKYINANEYELLMELQSNFMDVVSITVTNPPSLSPDYRLHQLLTTYSGLRVTDTEYVIKTRSDEKWVDLSPFVDKFYEDKEKLLTSNIFWKERESYHISDHLMMSKTNYFYNGLDSFLKKYAPGGVSDNKITCNACESSFGRAFLMGKYNGEVKDSKNAFEEDFECFDVNEIKDYHITYNGGPSKDKDKTYDKNNRWSESDDN